MKKLISALVIAFSLFFPVAVIANLMGTGYMELAYSPPIGGGYYLDYDGWVKSSTFGYTTSNFVEVFCVSSDRLASGNFSFYTITPDLDTLIGGGTFEKLSRAAWVGDHWKDYIGSYDPDYVKGEAQKAVWKIVGVMDIIGSDGLDLIIFNDATLQSPTANYNWYFALDSQDFIVPVPEPTSILLLGIGLLAFGLLGREKFKK